MPKIKLDWNNAKTAGCYGLTMQDGTRYTANTRGVVEVESKAHLRALRASGNMDLSTDMPTGFRGVVDDGGKWCEPCKFHGWDWQKRCPRCGGDMTPYAEVAE